MMIVKKAQGRLGVVQILADGEELQLIINALEVINPTCPAYRGSVDLRDLARQMAQCIQGVVGK
jgi:hypothetical protein